MVLNKVLKNGPRPWKRLWQNGIVNTIIRRFYVKEHIVINSYRDDFNHYHNIYDFNHYHNICTSEIAKVFMRLWPLFKTLVLNCSNRNLKNYVVPQQYHNLCSSEFSGKMCLCQYLKPTLILEIVFNLLIFSNYYGCRHVSVSVMFQVSVVHRSQLQFRPNQPHFMHFSTINRFRT